MTPEEINRINAENKKQYTPKKSVYCKNCMRIREVPRDVNTCPVCNKPFYGKRDYDSFSSSKSIRKTTDLPKFSKGYIIAAVVGVLLCLLAIPSITADEFNRSYSINHSQGDPHVTGILLLIFGGLIIVAVVGFYIYSIADYRLYQNDYEAYVKKHKNVKRQYHTTAYSNQTPLTNNGSAINVPKCPTCGSTNIKKISDLSRGAHALMFGIFSNTARSQFECQNCHYKW